MTKRKRERERNDRPPKLPPRPDPKAAIDDTGRWWLGAFDCLVAHLGRAPSMTELATYTSASVAGTYYRMVDLERLGYVSRNERRRFVRTEKRA